MLSKVYLTNTSLATGLISSWFVADLLLSRDDAPVRHIVQAIGSSSVEKGNRFVETHCGAQNGTKPSVYGSYAEVYQDPDVDIVYIGTPHAFHKRDCLDAIAARKPVLCEKAFTLNARDAREVLDTARRNGVYVAEAMWLRHRKLVHEDCVIGDVFRASSEFGVLQDIANLPAESRYRSPDLGAGSLLDLGIYALTWVVMALDGNSPSASEWPTILAAQTHWEGVEVATSAILHYTSTGRQGVVTSTTNANSNPDLLARIQGTKGTIEVHGPCASMPEGFTVYDNFGGEPGARVLTRAEGEFYDGTVPGRGYQFEADNAALDVLAGRLESGIMPWSETIRIMEMLDEIRRQGGTVYAADKE
jgi:predicted dehydrogenase